MDLAAKSEAARLDDPVGESPAESRAPLFESLRQSATLEFYASVQLLAERARFLTGASGVAVALDQGGQFVYCAAAGSSLPEVAATAEITKFPFRKCLKTGEEVFLAVETAGEGFHLPLAVPVLKDGKVVGFFEVFPGEAVFEDHDVEAVARLTSMVSTALEHLEAAEHSKRLIEEAKPQAPAPPVTPVRWHAPEQATSQTIPAGNSPAPDPADVHACTGCGFPVSGARTLCVDCEAHRDDPNPAPNPLAEMFATEKPESWISTHGYTIASLLVSALAVAIIYWLR